MARQNLLDEVIEVCDIAADVAREAVARALTRSGFQGKSPTVADLRRALPELRRALEETLPPARAYEATERIEIVLATMPDLPSEPPSLEELTRRLREANQKLSSRDFEGELADVEAGMLARKRRSIIPPSR